MPPDSATISADSFSTSCSANDRPSTAASGNRPVIGAGSSRSPDSGSSTRASKRSPATTARPTMRRSQKKPRTAMNSATGSDTSQPAQGEVPRNLMGIQFWISGDPAVVMVKVTEPKAMVPGRKRRGRSAARNSDSATG